MAKLRRMFVCGCCGCEFIAGKTEYSEFNGYDNQYPTQVLRINCPECGEPCRVEVRYD